jgi:hypothetical protein
MKSKIKSLEEFCQLDTSARIKGLRSLVVKQDTAKKEIAKILIAAEKRGDYGPGEMNSWCKDTVGIELRRAAQGTYEAANVMREIDSGKLAMTEAEFDQCPSYGLIVLSSLMKKTPEKVADALEIIRAGTDVTNKLRALIKGEKKPKVEDSKESGNSGSGEETGVSEIQTLPAPKGTSFFVPEGESVLNQPEIQARILEDLRNLATPQDCENMHEFLKSLIGQVHTRWEHLEAEAAKSPETAPAEMAVA